MSQVAPLRPHRTTTYDWFMITVTDQLANLNAVAAEGALERLCHSFGVDLLVMFGSAVDSSDPGDIDIAVAFSHSSARDLIGFIDALNELVPGNHLDVMDLDSAGPVASQRALTRCKVLFAKTPKDFFERQIFAINYYIETKPLREAILKSLAA